MLKPITNKKSKIKQKRRRIALATIIFLILIILYAIFHAKDYLREYEVNNFNVLEAFDKNKKMYSFKITKDDKNFIFTVESKYIISKNLIQEIEELEEENTTCLIIKSAQITTYPQCVEENNIIDYHLVSDKMKEKLDSKYFESKDETKDNYEKVTIKNIDDNTYYIWNYKGFYQISNNKKNNIPIFEKDIYNISNVAEVKDYLLIPDYNASYYFNKFYIINMSNGDTTTWDFKESIYFDGYYLGKYKNSLYYVDKKTNIEWELIPKKKKMRKVGTESKDGKILENDEWNKISVSKLTKENKTFINAEKYEYEIDNGLYIKYNNLRKKISNREVKEIITKIKDKVYYLSGDSLYYYTEQTGEIEVMSYFEWNFNYKNMIFIKENK